MTLYSVSWRFDSIPNIGTKNRVGSSRFDSKIIGTESGFGSIPRVGTDESGRFQYLEPKPDPTISLIKDYNNILFIALSFDIIV